MPADSPPYVAVWTALRADRYRCRTTRPDGRLCRRPTRNVARNADGRLRAVCLRHAAAPPKETR